MSRNKFFISQTLLNSWLYVFKLEDGYKSFEKTLNREPIPQTKAMLDGNRFEGIINAVCNGQAIDPSHEWYAPVIEISGLVRGARQQVRLYKDVTVGGVDFVLNGVLDYLKAGVIYDTKFSKSYDVGKYLDSPQHPMYFALVPEAYEFTYLICDGTYVYRETYRPEEVEPIEQLIKRFMAFLDKHNLVDIYTEKWRAQ